MIQPTVGRTVHYRLTAEDAEAINRRHEHGAAHLDEHRANATGAQVHVGNHAAAGFVYPAIIVRTFDNSLAVNLQVFLDGNDAYWATSRGYSTETDGCWFWPPRLDTTLEGR